MTMMPSKSTTNLQQSPKDNSKNNSSVYSYLNQSGLNFAPVSTATSRDESPPPAPPVRDSSTLKSIKYGPGHEKFPSWPVPAAADAPEALRGPAGGGSHRSKSWTDHTNYPKEKVIAYTRPYMKRQNSTYNHQKLKTVMEKCEKIPPETFESRFEKINRVYLPRVDHDGKPLGDLTYAVPSPPERDIALKPQLTQAELEEYIRSYHEPMKFNYDKNPHQQLTESGLEEFMEYTKNYEDSMFNSMSSKSDESILSHLHQKQLSYAQSEGYHSYVSSTDSTATPFLDRLRRDSDAVVRSNHPNWDDNRHEGRDSVVTTSSGSASSSETLKWLGSISDVSVASSSYTHLANSTSSRQLIAHSARVQTPQKHHSESILYMSSETQDGWKDRESRNNKNNKLKLFAINTYNVDDGDQSTASTNRLSAQSALSVADRINELEKQQKYSYFDPNKKHKVPDPTLKAIQKKALLSFYERHHSPSSRSGSWRSEPHLAHLQQATSQPQPPPRIKTQLPSRRASSASDYASGNNSKRSSLASRESKTTDSITKMIPRHQYSNSCSSLSTALIGPMIVGPSISIDDWVPDKPPERPPKNPHLRTAFPDLFQSQRLPSPDLPPPSPPTVLEDEVFNSDDPLPPPPPECNSNWQGENAETKSLEAKPERQFAAPQVKNSKLNEGDSKKELKRESSLKQTVGLPDRMVRLSSVRSSIKVRPTEQIFQQVSSKPYSILASDKLTSENKSEQILGFPSQRGYAERSSTRYPTTQKLALNGNIAISQKLSQNSGQYRAEPLRARDTTSSPPRSNRRHSSEEEPPPLQPRQMKINQSMRAKICHDPKPLRASPIKGSRPKELSPESMSQSKASYLASRRERDRVVPDSDTGSYKRTMSPNGHAISTEVIHESTNLISKDTSWPSTKNVKDRLRNNNNVNLIRRSSMNEKPCLANSLPRKLEEKEDLKRPNLVLPDVLPITAKLINSRSQTNDCNRSSLVTSNDDYQEVPKELYKTPPPSPSKTPPRGSPFAPLRTTTLSNTPSNINPNRTSPTLLTTKLIAAPTKINPIPIKTFANSGTSISPPSPKRASPQIKPSLSPTSPIKLSPLRLSPASSSSNSPLQTSPLTSLSLSSKSSSPDSTPPQTPKTSDCPQVIEGLQMIQRTEVILRVNTSTTDASSQTEKEELPPTPLPMRKKLQEEIDCEKLSEDLISHLPVSDRLKDLLVPGPDYKKSTDYVHGLFKVEVTSRPRPLNSPFRSKTNTPRSSPTPAISTLSLPSNKLSSSTSPSTTLESTSPFSSTSTYFTTSEPKAKFLTRYSQDMDQCNILKDTKDLTQKKEELVNRLGMKLEVLKNEQFVVSEECKLNEELGENVDSHLTKVARPHEAAKFRLHVEEIGKITSLLLGLSGRLARAENALMGMEDHHPEKRILESKRDKLLDQLEEAKSLKESIDKRSISVSNILCKYLDSDEYADYDHFINMKAKLIMDSKEIADKIKLGEEQLLALKETLIAPD